MNAPTSRYWDETGAVGPQLPEGHLLRQVRTSGAVCGRDGTVLAHCTHLLVNLLLLRARAPTWLLPAWRRPDQAWGRLIAVQQRLRLAVYAVLIVVAAINTDAAVTHVKIGGRCQVHS
jgi:hypothetical protein